MNPEFKNDEIHVRVVSCEQTVEITFFLFDEYHRMNREKDEPLSKFFNRLSIRYNSLSEKRTKTHEKKKKQKKLDNKSQPIKNQPKLVKILDEFNSPMDLDNMKVSDLKTNMKIEIETNKYLVKRNPPSVRSISAYPKNNVYPGTPIVPLVEFEFGESIYHYWLVESSPSNGDFTLCSNGQIFHPDESMVGCHIRLYCSAYGEQGDGDNRVCVFGRAKIHDMHCCVQSATTFCNRTAEIRQDYHSIPRTPILHRHASVITPGTTKQELDHPEKDELMRGADEIRVLSYNILAEPFATSEKAITELFNYCQPSHLETEYRLQLLLPELLGSDADVICLQECDKKSFEHYLMPLLGFHGYAGHYTNKTSSVLEGCAIFLRRQTLRVLKFSDLALKESVKNGSNLEDFFNYRADLRSVLETKIGTIGQFVVCQSTHEPSKLVIVTNTHLFYHPMAGYLRQLQLHLFTEALRRVQRGFRDEGLNFVSKIDLAVKGYEMTKAQKEEFERYLGHENFLGLYLTGLVPSNKYSSSPLTPANVACEDATAELSPLPTTKEITSGIVLLGDLNSTPRTAAVDFLSSGEASIEKIRHDLERLLQFGWEKVSPDEAAGASTKTTNSVKTESDSHSSKDFTPYQSGKGEPNKGPHQPNDEEFEQEGKKAPKGRRPRVCPGGSIDVQLSSNGEILLTTQTSTNLFSEILDENKEKEMVEGVNTGVYKLPCLKHQLGLTNAAGFPQFTNYTRDFKDLLDYIFVQEKSFEVVRVAPIPAEVELQEDIALPSVRFPSDHLSLCVDLKLK